MAIGVEMRTAWLGGAVTAIVVQGSVIDGRFTLVCPVIIHFDS
jgi:hypothetical protein